MRVTDVASSHQPAELQLTWLGQAGFLLRHRRTTILVDPYLTDAMAARYVGTRFPHVRLAPPPVDPATLSDVDVVLCSHRHSDHMDPQTLEILAHVSRAWFVVPAPWVDRVVGFGVDRDRIVGVREGVRLELGPTTIDPVLAAHETIERDDQGRSLCLGFVITLADTVLYHSGDCVPFDGQAADLRPRGIDVALLPVNGRDPVRTANGVPGNFHPAEAVDLAESIRAKALIAHHFGLFDFNTVDQPALDTAVAARDPHLVFVQPQIGHTYEVVRDA